MTRRALGPQIGRKESPFGPFVLFVGLLRPPGALHCLDLARCLLGEVLEEVCPVVASVLTRIRGRSDVIHARLGCWRVVRRAFLRLRAIVVRSASLVFDGHGPGRAVLSTAARGVPAVPALLAAAVAALRIRLPGLHVEVDARVVNLPGRVMGKIRRLTRLVPQARVLPEPLAEVAVVLGAARMLLTRIAIAVVAVIDRKRLAVVPVALEFLPAPVRALVVPVGVRVVATAVRVRSHALRTDQLLVRALLQKPVLPIAAISPSVVLNATVLVPVLPLVVVVLLLVVLVVLVMTVVVAISAPAVVAVLVGLVPSSVVEAHVLREAISDALILLVPAAPPVRALALVVVRRAVAALRLAEIGALPLLLSLLVLVSDNSRRSLIVWRAPAVVALRLAALRLRRLATGAVGWVRHEQVRVWQPTHLLLFLAFVLFVSFAL